MACRNMKKALPGYWWRSEDGLSLPLWERKRFQRLGFSQVLEIASEGEIPGTEIRPLSCKIYDLAEAKVMILLSPPPRGERGYAAPAHDNSTIFVHTPKTSCHDLRAPAAGWFANVSTRRKEGLSGCAVTCGRARKEAVAIGVPLAGGSLSRHVQSQPPGRKHAPNLPKGGRGGRPERACGGHDVLDVFHRPVVSGLSERHRSAIRVRAGISKPTPAVSPGRGRSNPGGGP